jgi:hypothetical protein
VDLCALYSSFFDLCGLILNLRLEGQFLQSDITNNSLDFLLDLKYLESGIQTCLIFWNSYLVSRFVMVVNFSVAVYPG